jgi:hypothetical protein
MQARRFLCWPGGTKLEFAAIPLGSIVYQVKLDSGEVDGGGQKVQKVVY